MPNSTINPNTPPDLHPNRFYSGKEISALLGVHMTTLYAWMNAGKFPRPRRVGPRTVRWTGRQIIDHLRETCDELATSDDLPW